MQPRLLLLMILVVLASEISAQVLFYDQTANVTTGGILVRKHTVTASEIYDTEGVEDFTVPSGQTWYIDSVVALGFYGTTVPVPPSASPAIVTIYSVNAGLPGTVLFADTLVDGDPDNDGTFECYLPNPIVLTSGTYFLSVRMYTTDYPWYWARITEQISSSPFLWQNPNGGYAVCTSWQALNPCLAIADSSVAFRLYGCYGPKPVIDLGATNTICLGDSLLLGTGSANSSLQHLWSTGATSNSINISTAGTYSVTVTDNTTGCSAMKTSNVSISNPIIQTSMNDDTICIGQNKGYSLVKCTNCDVLWSTGAITNNISVSMAGNYSVTVTDTINECSEIVSANLTVIDPGLVIVPGNLVNLCAGDEVVLSTTLAYESYIWWDGNNPAIFIDSAVIDNSGLYGVTVEDSFGCEAYDSVLVIDRPNPLPIIKKTVLSNYEVELSTTEAFTSYLWSNNDDDQDTKVKSSGSYSVTVTNEYGCEGKATTLVAGIWKVGIDENRRDDFKIYPNPASSSVQIEWPNTWVGNAENTLFDASGRLVKHFFATESTQRISIENLAPGFYTLTTTSIDGTTNSTLVIQ